MEPPALPVLFASLPAELGAGAGDQRAPWDVLGEPLESALAGLPEERIDSPVPESAHLSGDGIVVGAGVRIYPGATIEGPVYIGDGSTIRSGAYVRGGVWIGRGCLIGANTEVKHAVLLDGAKAPHLNYVGDSILGEGVNLGAGTILSNFRHDASEVEIATPGGNVATGRRKLGAVLGDGVLTGCNCVLHPGVVVGAGTQIYPGVQLRSGVYPAHHIVKLRQTLEVVERT